MYLKTLTLRGFKSFASATTLNFEPGITCVVGPNGSGKSNVVDALSWVMGEQGAKSLRGGKMEDVIFAGTAGRAPLGRAEVSLTIDNADGALPIDFAEVTISRTMFRNGGSEYAINGQPARLLDVQELLSDSGIGREMHVIVGQGQLDTILQATPEVRRGFVEEAAGVLKHRRRKEKALRKLDATQANLDRLQDLLTEIRRQLKPLARQASVARRAAVIQAEVRDARARLLADDLTQATLALESELADERALKARRAHAEAALNAAREAEAEADEAMRQAMPRLSQAQETWYGLAALRERVSSTSSIAAERVRIAAAQPAAGDRPSRDPEVLEREAKAAREQEDELRAEIERKQAALEQATEDRMRVELEQAAEERKLSEAARAIADRREGLARLTGQVNAAASRAEAALEQIARLEATHGAALERAKVAAAALAAANEEVGEVDAAALEQAVVDAEAAHAAATSALTEAIAAERAAFARKASLQARVEGLEMALSRRDGGAALMAASDRHGGVLGSLASLLKVVPGWEAAISAALGAAADAVAVRDVDAATSAFALLRDEDAGRATLVLAGATMPSAQHVPAGALAAREVVDSPAELAGAVARLLADVALVEDLDAAMSALASAPECTVVTRAGEVLSTWLAAGGSDAQPSLLEVQAAVDEARAALAEAQTRAEAGQEAVAAAKAASDAARAAVTEATTARRAAEQERAKHAAELGRLQQTVVGAEAEAARIQTQITDARQRHEREQASHAELAERLARAGAEGADLVEPDPTARDELAAKARQLRSVEMDTRLALRTVEERARSLAGRADALRRAAQSERDAQARARAKAEQVQREAEVATAVAAGAQWLIARVEEARRRAAGERDAAEEARAKADAAVSAARGEARRLARELEELVDTVHRDEIARAEQRMRIQQLGDRAVAELGITPEILLAEYGPENLIPVLTKPDGTALTDDDETPEPVPYVREAQAKRLRHAERALEQLGRVNPLALEEYDAMAERHAFLAEQLEDVRRTRADLTDLIADVDRRVEEVFQAAWADVEVAFGHVFSRLFPGGEGRLVLTEPGEWLTTGIDVEARPAGKKVKRLSLLSGGERSLVAVAFLVSLFIARPSPFYILDEVEAALDDTNLGRLLDIYEELRENSQLLIITHQKRTMEIADALYGVTMRGDGVTTVISQRLRRD